MAPEPLHVDSGSIGDPGKYRTLDELQRGLAASSPPRDVGQLVKIVRRGERGTRQTLARIRVAPDTGVPGDAWGRQRTPHPDAQITVMQIDIATLIANGQPLELFGDNLFLDLDLSSGNLPVGSRVRIGDATLEVTPMPHNGCGKFRARFGGDALRFVSSPETRHRNFRGIYMRVLQAGHVASGDPAEVVVRPGRR